MTRRRHHDHMFGKTIAELTAIERDRADMDRRLKQDAAEAEARLDAPLSRREVLEAIEYAMSTCAGPERSMLRDLKEALS